MSKMGTAHVKYQVTEGFDVDKFNGHITTLGHSIVFMKEYENTSFEELRYVDRCLGRDKISITDVINPMQCKSNKDINTEMEKLNSLASSLNVSGGTPKLGNNEYKTGRTSCSPPIKFATSPKPEKPKYCFDNNAEKKLNFFKAVECKDIEVQVDLMESEKSELKAKLDDEIQKAAEVQTKYNNLTKFLQTILECPVCLDMMSPPLRHCCNGHLICDKCRRNVTECPVCRGRFAYETNRVMEMVAERLEYPCRFSCGAAVPLAERSEHEGNCWLRTFSCPVMPCTLGTLFSHVKLQEHILSIHPQLVHWGSKVTFVKNHTDIKSSEAVVVNFSSIFNIMFYVNKKYDGIVIYVVCIDRENMASKFLYEVTVTNLDQSRKLTSSHPTHKYSQLNVLNENTTDTFFITMSEVKNFVKSGGTDVHFKVTIVSNIWRPNTLANDK